MTTSLRGVKQTLQPGATTLLSSSFQQMALEHPEMVKKGFITPQPWKVSSASMAIYSAHEAEIHRYMQSPGPQALEDNGGRLTSCQR